MNDQVPIYKITMDDLEFICLVLNYFITDSHFNLTYFDGVYYRYVYR